jgi:hypothetical protein
MQPFAPFTGVIVLPDRAMFGTTSPVSLGDGQPVAGIRWHNWTMRARFEIADPAGTTMLATGGRVGVWGRRYQVLGPRSDLLLELKLSLMGPTGRSTVTLANGQVLTTAGNWTNRKFSVVDQAGTSVAQLVNTSRVFSMRPDSLLFELRAPVLSIVQAIGLAQCMRAAVEAQRSSAAAST